MKNKTIAVYSSFAFLALAGAVVWFFLSVSTSSRNGSIEAKRSFDWISRESSTLSSTQGFMSDDFILGMNRICGQSRLLKTLFISTPSGVLYVWPSDSPYVGYVTANNPSFVNSPIFSQTFSGVIDTDDGAMGSVTLTALVQGLETAAIHVSLRNSFFIVLAVFLVTLIIILLQSLKNEPTTSKNRSENYPDLMDSIETYHREPIEPQNEHYSDLDFQEIEEDTHVELNSVNSAEIYSENKTEESAPEGLFSPLTGIGWEEYLEDRLDAELVRAASSEQDLSLIIVQIELLSRTDLLSKKISKVLLETFRFRDMVFEFGTNGFAGILINMNLDQSMKIADALYVDIDSVLIEMDFETRIHIGITTRSARLLPASRMIDEALSAAKKAAEEPQLPIVAFRANPEKYRSFLAGKI